MKIYVVLMSLCLVVGGCSQLPKTSSSTIYIASDSTAADHTLNEDYQAKRHPVTGWGQALQVQLDVLPVAQRQQLFGAKQLLVANKARGGRSSRTFFEEGRWDEIYRNLQPGDWVLIQFGHNDAAVDKTERYTNIAAYKQYLRLFVQQARERQARPVVLTPVSRNYPWMEGKLGNAHGDYPAAARDVAQELAVPLLDLGLLSAEFFSAKGEAYVSSHYFMNLPAGKYPAYPEGLKDNTHFQPEGAAVTAKLVVDGLIPLLQPAH